jgi:flavin reductase (DIM6/NTAB) family NADH-FMN oxidoreductase RutF
MPLTDHAQAAITEVFHLYDPPLWLVTSRDHERRGGFIATAVTRASILPDLPRILIAVARHHHTWGLIESSSRFALHLLAREDLAAVWCFGLASGHQVDKLAGLDCGTTPGGAPLYREAIAWLDCRVETRLDTGDRTAYLAAVTAGAVIRRAPPLTVATLLEQAPTERRAELKRRYALDQDKDRDAILAWREARGRLND